MKFNTRLIHGNFKIDELGASNTPIYLSNAYAHNSAKKLEGIFKGTAMGYAYSRISNPTVSNFEKRMASIEGGLVATATASGMSAVYLAIINILETGDEIIASSSLFGGSYNLINNLKSFGIGIKFIDNLNEANINAAITDKTKVLFAETIGNPKLNVLDLEEVSRVCRENNIIFIVDSTATTPYLIRPIEYGADVVIHSTSKYVNGTANALGGVIIDGGSDKYKDSKFKNFAEYARKYGKMAFTAKLKAEIGKDIGAALSPFNASLNLTGVETLSLRVKEHCRNAIQVAEYLSSNDKVVSVNYPGLKDSEHYDLAQKYYKNGVGGILTFRLGSKEKAFKFIDSLKLILNTPNIGDTKTLIIHPASTICVSNTEEEKIAMGVYDDLLRLSVGIEDVEDILTDIENALGEL